jgi:hypothetical protein
MTLSLNIASEIEAAALAGDSALLASIARALLAGGKKPATKARKSAQAVDSRYLTLTERRALGLPPLKRGKIGGGVYRWVLVEFASGFRMVTGQYPDAKAPDDLTQAVISARARYLGILSGRYLNARYSAQVPAILSVRQISRDEALDMRESCQTMRHALAVFTRDDRTLRVLAYLSERRARHTQDSWLTRFQQAAE